MLDAITEPSTSTAVVADIMRKSPKTILGLETVREALRTMTFHQIRHLVVVSPSGAACGLISQRDLLRSLAQFGDGLALIHDVMSSPVIGVEPDALVNDAARMMWDRRIGCLPVITAAGELVGIFTRSDVLRHFGMTYGTE